MIIRYDMYQFTGRKLISLVEKSITDEKKMFRAAKKFEKQHGAIRTWFSPQGLSDSFICGFGFKTPPGELWKKAPRASSAWIPRRNSSEAKKLSDQFKSIPKVCFKELKTMVKWEIMTDEDAGKMYFSRFFWSKRKGKSLFCGMRVPVLHGKDVSTYRPILGMKLITINYYQKMIDGAEGET